MKIAIWLDDIRNPLEKPWSHWTDYVNPHVDKIFWCTNYKQFVDTIDEYGLPVIISFDNDLGEEKEGYDCAKWLIEYCLDNNVDLPEYSVHSSNIPAKDNMLALFNNFKKFRDE